MNPVDRRPDIALFGSFPVNGGVPRRLANMIKEWAAGGYAVDLVGFRDGQCFYPDEIGDLVRFVDLGTHRKVTTLLALWRYARAARPRVLVSTAHLTNMIVARLGFLPGLATKRFLCVENTFGASKRRDPRSQARKLRAVRRIYRHADGVIAISNGVRDDLTETIGLSGVPVHRIYNGVIAPDNQRLATEPVEHPWLGTDRREPVLITAGRLAQQKDHKTLLRALARMKEDGSPSRLIILGEGGLHDELVAYAEDLGIADRVDLPGWVDNPYSWMARADCFVLSSLWEGFANVLAEALGLGVPCVATDCPSGPAEILDNGRYGRLVPMGDSQQLAEAVEKTLVEGSLGFDVRSATRNFTSEAAARNYLKVFGLLESAAPGAE